jgi:hypothetical protein
VLDPWGVLGSLFAPKVVLFDSVDHSRGVFGTALRGLADAGW